MFPRLSLLRVTVKVNNYLVHGSLTPGTIVAAIIWPRLWAQGKRVTARAKRGAGGILRQLWIYFVTKMPLICLAVWDCLSKNEIMVAIRHIA